MNKVGDTLKLFQKAVKPASPASLVRLKELAVTAAEKERNKHLGDIGRLRRHAE